MTAATRTPPRKASASPTASAAVATPSAGAALVLAGIPDGLRTELVEELNKIARHFREGRWEPAELDGGRLCEIVYSIVKGEPHSAVYRSICGGSPSVTLPMNSNAS